MKKGLLAIGVFLVLFSLPMVYNAASAVSGLAGGHPALAQGKGEKCVKDGAWMKRNHMQMLKHVRDSSVREGIVAGQTGLQGCVSCHPKRGEFCDRCHSYVGVSPECWRCHNYPV